MQKNFRFVISGDRSHTSKDIDGCIGGALSAVCAQCNYLRAVRAQCNYLGVWPY